MSEIDFLKCKEHLKYLLGDSGWNATEIKGFAQFLMCFQWLQSEERKKSMTSGERSLPILSLPFLLISMAPTLQSKQKIGRNWSLSSVLAILLCSHFWFCTGRTQGSRSFYQSKGPLRNSSKQKMDSCLQRGLVFQRKSGSSNLNACQ